jgi:hypothetical protein
MGYLISAALHFVLKLVKILCLRKANPLSGLFANAEFQNIMNSVCTTLPRLHAFYLVDTGTILH